MRKTNKLFIERLKYIKRFCKDNGIYTSFFRNIKQRSHDKDSLVKVKYNGSWEKMVYEKSIRNIIDGSFIWINTPEGHGFWQGKSWEFIKQYDEKNIKL